jgi:hypothetical protein
MLTPVRLVSVATACTVLGLRVSLAEEPRRIILKSRVNITKTLQIIKILYENFLQ